MRRVVLLAAVAATIAAVIVAVPGSAGERSTIRVELDNAFGLTPGVDVRAAGVRIGRVAKLEVDPRTARAIVSAEIEDEGFGSFRTDATCRVEPQSLIGEYFLDCDAGKSAQELGDGGLIPVERTAGTVPPDVVNDVLRRPYRERLGIILSELGAGFATRGPDLAATIRRGVPALRETDRVLALLAQERQTLRGLARDADVVLGRLAAGREQVGRFVEEAGDAAAATAARRDDLRTTIRTLPAFLRGLRPTLAELGTVAERQTPALRDLRAASGDLTTLFRRLGPFSRAALPAVTSLAEASSTGRRAVRAAASTVAQLRATSGKATDPLRNLRFVLEHLDDRDNAVEPNRASPGGKGFTGLEAVLQYLFVQPQAINLYDNRGYTLKLNVLVNECTQYTNARTALANPERTKRCSAALGSGAPPLQPEPQAAARAKAERDDERSAPGALPAAPAAPPSQQAAQPAAPAPAAGTQPAPAVELPGIRLPPIRIPGLPEIRVGGDGGKGERDASGAAGLLDLLLAP